MRTDTCVHVLAAWPMGVNIQPVRALDFLSTNVHAAPEPLAMHFTFQAVVVRCLPHCLGRRPVDMRPPRRP